VRCAVRDQARHLGNGAGIVLASNRTRYDRSADQIVAEHHADREAWPVTRRWCRCHCSTAALASARVSGTTRRPITDQALIVRISDACEHADRDGGACGINLASRRFAWNSSRHAAQRIFIRYLSLDRRGRAFGLARPRSFTVGALDDLAHRWQCDRRSCFQKRSRPAVSCSFDAAISVASVIVPSGVGVI
jgi:hypothetical protein